MATWPGTKTITVNDPALASDWNSFVRDAFLFLYNPPAVRAYNSSSISIPHNTETALTFDAERYDTDTMHSSSTNPGRLTCNTEGKYFVKFGGAFTTNGTGVRQIKLRKNGTINIDLASFNAVAAHFTWFGASTDVQLSVGDYVEAVVFQTSGGALDLMASPQASPEFMAHWFAGL